MNIFNTKGIFYYGDGSVYQGNFKSGVYEGEGKLTWKNGDVYEGGWRDGKVIIKYDS
jgi:hypothetical protein